METAIDIVIIIGLSAGSLSVPPAVVTYIVDTVKARMVRARRRK